jgi:hypothetical protein
VAAPERLALPGLDGRAASGRYTGMTPSRDRAAASADGDATGWTRTGAIVRPARFSTKGRAGPPHAGAVAPFTLARGGAGCVREKMGATRWWPTNATE